MHVDKPNPNQNQNLNPNNGLNENLQIQNQNLPQGSGSQNLPQNSNTEIQNQIVTPNQPNPENPVDLNKVQQVSLTTLGWSLIFFWYEN